MKKLIFIIILITLLFAINDLLRSIFDLWQKKDIVAQAQKELSFQKQENQRLKAGIFYAQTEEFIEKEARDKLFMVKKDEKKVLIPKESKELKSEAKTEVNWRKWWNLFF